MQFKLEIWLLVAADHTKEARLEDAIESQEEIDEKIDSNVYCNGFDCCCDRRIFWMEYGKEIHAFKRDGRSGRSI